MLGGFYYNDRWFFKNYDGTNLDLVSDLVKKNKPRVVLEAGTGKDAGYAGALCSALKENNIPDSRLISYELCSSYYESAKEKLAMFGDTVDLKQKDMFSFFTDYELQPDLYLLDAGDEKLWNENWSVPGKDYGRGSLYNKGESENLNFFLDLQNKRSIPGTIVILDDFLIGRGTYIGNYAIKNHTSFDLKWKILDIFVAGPASLCILERVADP
jgi:hypothetical protein